MRSNTSTEEIKRLLDQLDGRLRVLLAFDQMPPQSAEQFRVLERFATSIPFASGEDASLVEVALSLDAALGWQRVSCVGPGMTLWEASRGFVEGFDAGHVALLEAMGRRIEPSRVGHWVGFEHDEIDAGWIFPDAMPLSKALAMVEPSAGLQDVIQWAKAGQTEQALGVMRSVVRGTTHLRIPLGAGHARPTLDRVDEALRRFLGMDPTVLIETLHEHPPGGTIALALSLSSAGVDACGVHVEEPSEGLRLILTHALSLDTSLEKVARIEAAVGVDQPQRLVWLEGREGTELALDYLAGV